MLAFRAVSHILVTMEASDPAERERSRNWNMLTVLFTQSGSSVKNWSPSSRTATACVILGGLHISTLALSLQAISKAGRAFSFVKRARVCHIYGSSSGHWTLASQYSDAACRYQRSSGIFLFFGAACVACCAWCKI